MCRHLCRKNERLAPLEQTSAPRNTTKTNPGVGDGETVSRFVSNSRIIGFAWRVAVIIAVVSQLLTAAIQTPWGARNFLLPMVRAGIFQAAQVSAIQNLVYPPGADAVRSLERAIAKTVPKERPIIFVQAGTPSIIVAAHLAYEIYPRTFVQPGSAKGIRNKLCRVDWQSGSEVTLLCPDSVWRYGRNGGTSR